MLQVSALYVNIVKRVYSSKVLLSMTVRIDIILYIPYTCMHALAG